MLKKISLALFIIGLLSSQVFSVVSYRLEDFQTPGKSSIGIITKGSDSYFKMGLSPDLEFGALGIGFDLNLYVPMGSNKSIPSEFQWFSFRKISYQEQNWGLQWGRLTNISYGYGLLLDRYDSGSAGSPEFNTSKAALEGYYKQAPYGVRGLTSASNFKAVRADYTVDGPVLFGKPLIIGVNYAEDSDGVNDSILTTHNIVSAQSGFSVDAGVPIFDKTLRVYTEYAKLTNKGSGAALGIGGELAANFTYKLEYRMLGANFLPGYFNAIYEASTTPNAFPSSETSGLMGYMGISLFDDYIKTEFLYESYANNDPMLSAAIGWRKVGPTVGVINYIKSFSNPNGGRVNAYIAYDDFPLLPIPGNAVIGIQRDYKDFRDFGNKDNYTETVTIAVQPNLGKMFNIPFL